MTGRGEEATRTAPFSSTSSGGLWPISCLTASLRPSRLGSRLIRDRAGGYAEGATKGAPQAIQLADRFHLLKNLTEAVQRALERHQRTLRSVPASEHRDPVPSRRGGPISERTGDGCSPPRRSERTKTANRERRLAKYHDVAAFWEKGLSHTEIGRRTGLSRATVIRWLRSDGFS